jgi:ribonuclease HI
MVLANTLLICHDGSYMKKVTSNVCATAVVMYCTATGFELTCTWVECCDEADNYRAELLGALCSSLLLKAASSVAAVYGSRPLIHLCDNMGVVKHGNTPYLPLKDKQSHSDVVRLFKQLERELPFPRVYEWVEGHVDACKGRLLTLRECLNDRCDALAKEALMNALFSGSFISSNFPFETIRVKLGPKSHQVSLTIHSTSLLSANCQASLWLWSPRQ